MVLSCVEKKKKSPLAKKKSAAPSRRNATLAPAGAAELSDVMKGRRWRLMPLRSKESGSLKQKVCAIKAEKLLGGNDRSVLSGSIA